MYHRSPCRSLSPIVLLVALAGGATAHAGMPAIVGVNQPVPPENQLTTAQKFEILTDWTIAEWQAASAPFCWRHSYSRGVGQVQGLCPAGHDKQNNLCYPACKPGFKPDGPVCWQICPPGYADDGLTCHRHAVVLPKPPAYGRGAGYASPDQCGKDNPQGCEKDGLLHYPKCNPGFHAFGCCVCTPDCPAGYTDDGATCSRAPHIFGKESYGRGAGILLTPGSCGPNAELEGGLCYPTCSADYQEHGTVCWQKCPPGQPSACGAGCAADVETCSEYTANMVQKPVEFFIELVKVPLGGSWNSGAKAIHNALLKGGVALAKTVAINTAKSLGKALLGSIKRTAKVAVKIGARELVDAVLERSAEKYVTASMAKAQVYKDVWDVVMAVDPTGTTTVVDAFLQPACRYPTQPPRFAHLRDTVLAGAHGGQRGSIEALVDRGKHYGFTFLAGGSWHVDASTFRGTTLGGSAGMAFNPKHNHVDVFTRDADGTLHYYSVPSGAWVEVLPVPPLKVGFGSPLATVNLGGNWPESEVWFKAEDGQLSNVIKQPGGQWLDARPWQPKVPPVADTNALAAVAVAGLAEAYWYGTDDKIHRMFVSQGAWAHELVCGPVVNTPGATDCLGGLDDPGPMFPNAKFSQESARTDAIAAVHEPGRGVTVFVAEQGKLTSMTRTPGGWRALEGSYPYNHFPDKHADAVGDVAAVVSPLTGRAEVFYRGEDGDLYNVSFRDLNNQPGVAWTHRTPSATLGVPKIRIAGRIAAAWSPSLQGVEVLVVSEDSLLHYYLVKDGVWTHRTI